MRLDKQVQEWFPRTPGLVEAMFDGFPDVMFYVKDAAGRYLRAHQTRIERARLKVRANTVGETADPLFPVAGSSTVAQDLEVIRTARLIRDSLRLYRNCRGDRFWCLSSKFPLLDASGHIVGLAGLSRGSATAERAPSKPQPTRAIPGLHRRWPGWAPQDRRGGRARIGLGGHVGAPRVRGVPRRAQATSDEAAHRQGVPIAGGNRRDDHRCRRSLRVFRPQCLVASVQVGKAPDPAAVPSLAGAVVIRLCRKPHSDASSGLAATDLAGAEFRP